MFLNGLAKRTRNFKRYVNLTAAITSQYSECKSKYCSLSIVNFVFTFGDVVSIICIVVVNKWRNYQLLFVHCFHSFHFLYSLKLNWWKSQHFQNHSKNDGNLIILNLWVRKSLEKWWQLTSLMSEYLFTFHYFNW